MKLFILFITIFFSFQLFSNDLNQRKLEHVDKVLKIYKKSVKKDKNISVKDKNGIEFINNDNTIEIIKGTQSEVKKIVEGEIIDLVKNSENREEVINNIDNYRLDKKKLEKVERQIKKILPLWNGAIEKIGGGKGRVNVAHPFGNFNRSVYKMIDQNYNNTYYKNFMKRAEKENVLKMLLNYENRVQPSDFKKNINRKLNGK